MLIYLLYHYVRSGFLYSKTCFEWPLNFSTKIGRKRQVALQKKGKININLRNYIKDRLYKVTGQNRTVNDKFYSIVAFVLKKITV